MSDKQTKELTCPHCETEISEHEAGRCLDAWVAEVAMGELALRAPSPIYVGRFDWVMKGDWYVASEQDGPYRVPHYSTDIAAAWEVVGRMGSMWMDATVPNMGIDVEFKKGKKGTASTAPLAICRAALKASGAT